MAIDPTRAGCPDAQELAAYAERLLPGAARAAVEQHLVECADCRDVLVATTGWLAASRDPVKTSMSVPWRLMAGVAAAAVLVLGIRFWWLDGTGRQSDLQALVAAVGSGSTRLVDGRLTGGFGYAPMPPIVRSKGDAATAVPPSVRALVAAIEREALAAPSSLRDAVLGVAYLVGGDVEASIVTLERASAGRLDDARIWSDLAAAYLERGASGDFEKARDAADRALALESTLAEAAFNRAAALEGLGDREAAIAGWRRAAGFESGSPWAAEAERRASALATGP
jgi:tetratricopeptide (TPR) repeat protein